MKIKTSEATGLQLDWGLAIADGSKPELKHGNIFVPFANFDGASLKLFSHAMPSVCMGLIKEYCIQLFPFYDFEDVRWDADIRPDVRIVNCDTPEQAGARCGIAMKLGVEFEVPDELGVMG